MAHKHKPSSLSVFAFRPEPRQIAIDCGEVAAAGRDSRGVLWSKFAAPTHAKYQIDQTLLLHLLDQSRDPWGMLSSALEHMCVEMSHAGADINKVSIMTERTLSPQAILWQMDLPLTWANLHLGKTC